MFNPPNLSCDYLYGAHPKVMDALSRSNFDAQTGYGADIYTIQLKERIAELCDIHHPFDVRVIAGGTQTNMVALDMLLKPYQGVIAADSGHIATHEAGAIEASGHKVLNIGCVDKIDPEKLARYMELSVADANAEHMVQAGAVYISQPTEMGSLYSAAELARLREICDTYELAFYVDGARLAYALGASDNDVTWETLGKYADAFYIGGTKCGTLFGEALVINNEKYIDHVLTQIKRRGALLAKGKVGAVQMLELLKKSRHAQTLYQEIGRYASFSALKLGESLEDAGFALYRPVQTNQILVRLREDQYEDFNRIVRSAFFDREENGDIVVRIAIDWATRDEMLIAIKEQLKLYKEEHS